jgi:hypothetical protein
MEDKYRLNKIGDGWEFVPEDILREKFDYERLLNNIKRREQKIISDLNKISQLKDELKEMKKKRTVGYNKMVKYHKQFTPSFTISFSKTKKKNRYYNYGDVDSRGNWSWTIIPNVGGNRKWIYLGSNKEVTTYLDLMEGRSNLDYYNGMYPHERTPHENKIKMRIEELLCPLIVSDMKRWMKTHDNLDGWFDRDFKKDYLMNKLKRMYKKSKYFGKHQKDPKLKGLLKSGFTVIQPNPETGSTIYLEKKKWTHKQWEEYYRKQGNKELEKKYRDLQKKRKK